MAFDAYMIDCTQLVTDSLSRFTGAGVNNAAWTKSGDMVLCDQTIYKFTGAGVNQAAWTSNGNMLLFSVFEDAAVGRVTFEKPYYRPYTRSGEMYPVLISARPVVPSDTMHEIILGPCVDFTFSIVGYLVYFNDLSTEGGIVWHWYFGDGGESTEENPVYQYTVIGTYLVTLMVEWPNGYIGYSQDWITITTIKRSGIYIIGVV